MKKLCMLFCIVLFILSEATAMGALVEIDEFSCQKVINKKIFGDFEVTNLTGSYYDRLNYILYLIPERNYNGSIIMSSAESIATPFSLMPNETKFIAYEFKYPANMPFDNYVLVLLIYDNSDDLFANKEITNFQIGKKDSEYIIPGDKVENNYYKIKDYEFSLSGPTIGEDGKLEGYININSTFKEDKRVTPYYSIFKRDLVGEQLTQTEKGESILIKSNNTKEVKVNLPIVKEPGTYFVKVRFVDENNRLVSGEYYFRYVVKGDSAKISTIGTSLNTENNVLNVSFGYVGAADGSVLKDYIFITGVMRTRSGDILEMFADKEDIYATSYKANYSLGVPEEEDELTVWASIGKEGKTLSEYKVIVNRSIFENEVLKFEDLISTKYEDYVKTLESYGVISGYPDGTFKPSKTLTRAELTAIALNMKKVNLNDYEVKTNNFSDLPENHWAYKTINYAAENGIVNGYGNGLFKPDLEVKYSEALAILINVAGYGEQVNALSEGWPYNYISFAEKWNITKDTEIKDYLQVASRGEVAVMTLNTYYLRKD